MSHVHAIARAFSSKRLVRYHVPFIAMTGPLRSHTYILKYHANISYMYQYLQMCCTIICIEKYIENGVNIHER